MIHQGEVWWATLSDSVGSEAGFRRPVVVIQGDRFNRSRISTAVCVPLTGELRWADAPGNVLLPARSTGLRRGLRSIEDAQEDIAAARRHL